MNRVGLPASNQTIVTVTSSAGAVSIDLKQFEGKWVWMKAEGAAGESVGYHTWRVDAGGAPAAPAAGQIGENADPDLAATSGAGQCAALLVDEPTPRKYFVVPAFTILRVVGSALGSPTLRIWQAQI